MSAAPLAIAGIILGLVSRMGWLITLDRQQRISVLLGGLLSTIPLVAGMSIHLLVAADPQNVILRFIRFGSVFCFTFVLLLLIRAAQAMSGAVLYERKVARAGCCTTTSG